MGFFLGVFSFKKLFYLFFVFCVFGCDSTKGLDSFGLTLLHLNIERDEFSRLTNTGLSKSPVAAKLAINSYEVPIQVSYSGNSTIKRLKKSYQIDFLDRPFRSRRIYRASAHTQDPSLLKGVLGAFMLSEMGQMHSEIEPATLYLNRQYQGLYVFLEPVDADYFHRRGISISHLYKAKVAQGGFKKVMVTDPEYGVKAKVGAFNRLAVSRLASLAHKPIGNEHKAQLGKLIDFNKFIEFVAAAVVMQNLDTFDNNYHIYQTSRSSVFHFFHWDWDMIFKEKGGSFESIESLILNKNALVQKVLEYPEFQVLLESTIKDFIQGPLTVSKIHSYIDEQASLIKSAYQNDRHLGREGKLSFESEKQYLKDTVENWINFLDAKY